MPAPHSVENYTISKGVMYIGEWVGTTPPASIVTDMGNAPSAEVEITVERIPHVSSRAEFNRKDKNPLKSVDYMVNFELDEPAAANMKRYIMGTMSGGNVVHALQNIDQEYALKFVENNPTGPNKTHEFWRGTITPNGPMQLISEEWMTLSYRFEGLSDIENHPTSPHFDVTYDTTTTTTTTTA